MTFKETYEKTGNFTHTDATGKRVTRKYTMRYTFTDKMKTPEVVIKGTNLDEKTIQDFLTEVNTRFHRAFKYLPGLKRIEELPEKT